MSTLRHSHFRSVQVTVIWLLLTTAAVFTLHAHVQPTKVVPGMPKMPATNLAPNSNSDIYVLQRSDAQIVAVNGFLNCDGLMCPWLSIYCYVQRDTVGNDYSRVRRLRVCMLRDGKLLI